MRNRVLLRLYFVLLASGAGILGMVSSGQAQTGDGISGIVASILSSVANVFIELGGKIFTVLIDILLSVVSYSDFINAPAVTKAWVLVRDFSNMAFLIIFIAIAFATILGVEKYEYKQLLPKLLFMAVAINFSRTLCGLVLDAAQVVMMTFVNGFRDVAAGNLIRGFGLADLTSLDPVEAARRGVDASSIAIASILAVIMLIVSVVTVGAILVVLITRIIFLWVLIILSPLAFMMAAAPGMSGKFSEWWGKFVRYAFVGPILAFFLWLSFSIMAAVNPGQSLATSNGFSIGSSDSISGGVSAAITTVSNSENILSFAIAVALLMMSLMVSSELGVKGGELASAALSKIQSGGVKLAKLGALGIATGGAGFGVGAAAALGLGTKFGRKKMDDWISPVVTKYPAKGLSYVAKKAGLGDTRFGLAVGALAQTGTKVRVLQAGWKARKEKREKEKTAVEAGAAQDLFNGMIDGKKTKYASRQQAGLVHAEAKEQQENTSGTTDEYMEILKNGSKTEQKAALLNLAKQNDWNSALLDGKIGDEVRKKILGDMKKQISPDIDKEINAILELSRSVAAQEKAVIDEGEASSKAQADLKIAEETLETVRQGGDEDKIKNQEQVVAGARTKAKFANEKFSTAQQGLDKNKQAEIKNRVAKLDRNGRAYYKYQRYQYVDSDRHKEALVKTLFDENKLTADFMAELGQVGLKSGAMGAFGLTKFNKEKGEMEFAQTDTDKGMTGHLDAIMSKFRNMKSGELLGVHPTVLRDEIIDENGEHRYDEDITEAGKMWIAQSQQYFTERNLGNIRPDSFAAMCGVHIAKFEKGLRSLNRNEVLKTRRELSAALQAGYERDLKPLLSPTSTVDFEKALDKYDPDKEVEKRSGPPPGAQSNAAPAASEQPAASSQPITPSPSEPVSAAPDVGANTESFDFKDLT